MRRYDGTIIDATPWGRGTERAAAGAGGGVAAAAVATAERRRMILYPKVLAREAKERLLPLKKKPKHLAASLPTETVKRETIVTGVTPTPSATLLVLSLRPEKLKQEPRHRQLLLS